MKKQELIKGQFAFKMTLHFMKELTKGQNSICGRRSRADVFTYNGGALRI